MKKILYLKEYFSSKIISEEDGYKFYNLLKPLAEDNNINKIIIDFNEIDIFVCNFIHNSISKLVFEKGLHILKKIQITNLEQDNIDIIQASLKITINKMRKNEIEEELIKYK